MMNGFIPLGAEFLVNTATLNSQLLSTIASLSSGGFVVSWIDFSGEGGDTSGYGIKAQIFSAINTSPDAVDDVGLTTPEDTALVIAAASLLANDVDIDGDTLTVTAVGNAIGGMVALANGQVTFTPSANFNGPASFSYTVSDGNGGSDTATVSLTVTAVNDAPVANDDAGTATEQGTSPGTAATGNVLANDTDVDTPDTQEVTIVKFGPTSGTPGSSLAGSYGSLTLNANGTYSYAVNNANLAVNALRLSTDTLTDTFAYTMRDAAGATSSAQLVIMIHGANDAPIAVADSIAVNEDATSANLWNLLLGNDTDVDLADAKKIVSIDATGTVGTVSLNTATQSLTFSADNDASDLLANGQSAATTFTYTIEDAAGARSTAVVTVNITGQADGQTFDGTAKADVITVGAGPNNTTSGEDTVHGLQGADTISGGGGTDRLFGDQGDDILNGDAGADFLYGGQGNDRLAGGTGNDWLQGDQGSDLLFGGDGSDTFAFLGLRATTERDTIFDFSSVDRIKLGEGVTATVTQHTDVNGDGSLDTLLVLSTGGSILLSNFDAWTPDYLI